MSALALANAVPPPRKASAGSGGAGVGSVEADHRWLVGGGPRGAAQAAAHGSAGLAAAGGGARGGDRGRHGPPLCARRSGMARTVAPAEVIVPQRHPLGEEAEVDFGTIHLSIWLGCWSRCSFSSCASPRRAGPIARAYLNEGQEVFLDGHVRAFEPFRGMPGRIRYDNLKAAVDRVLDRPGPGGVGPVRGVAVPLRFRQFLLPAGPQGQPREGRRGRRSGAVPAPSSGPGARGWTSMAELNELLSPGAWPRDDRRRVVAHRRLTCRRAFRSRGRRACGRLPAERFDVPGAGRQSSGGPQEPGCRSEGLFVLGSRPLRGPAAGGPRGRRDDRGPRRGAGSWPATPAALKVTRCWCLDHYLEVLAVKPGALPGATASGPSPGLRQRSATAHHRLWASAADVSGDRAGTQGARSRCCCYTASCPPTRCVAGHRPGARRLAVSTPAVVAIEARRSAQPAHRSQRWCLSARACARFDRPAPSIAIYD